MSFGDLQAAGGSQRQRPNYSPGSGLRTDNESPRDFQAVLRHVRSNLDIVAERVKAIQRLVALLSSPSASTPQLQSKLGLLQGETRRYIAETNSLLNTLQSMATPGTADTHGRLQQIAKARKELTEDDDTLSKLEAQAAQAIARAELSANQTSKSRQQPKESYQDDERQPLMANQHAPLQSQLVVTREIDYNEAIVAEREEALLRIHSDVRDVNEMMRDMGYMVAQQGTSLDHIEANVTNVGDNTAKGLEELQQARTHQRSATGKKCCLLFTGLVVLTVLIVFILMATINRRH